MASFKEPSPDQPFEKPGKSIKDPQSYEKVVEELKNVLAGLNQTSPPESSADEIGPAEELLRTTETPALPENVEEPKPPAAEPVFPPAEPFGSPTPSDAEFWNGNVLGWSDSLGNQAKDKTSNPSLENPAQPDPPVADVHANVQMPMESPTIDPIWGPAATPDVPQIFNASLNPLPSSAPDEEDSQYSGQPPVIPTPPLSPLEREQEQSLIIENLGTTNVSETSAFFQTPPENTVPMMQQGEEGDSAQNAGTILPANLKIPIPGTLHQIPGESKVSKQDQTLQEMNIQPTNVIQIGCLFPEGRDADSHEFLTHLKTAALKASSSHTIELVLTNPWFRNQIDISSWKKAASLSGANFLFVLAHKKDKDLFKDVSKVTHHDEVRARVVILEQIKLRTLYADLVAELLRMVDGKN